MNIFNFLSKTLLSKNLIISLILEIIFIEISIIFFHKILKKQFSKINNLIYLFINIFCFIVADILGNPMYGYGIMLISSITFTIYIAKIPSLKVLSFMSLFNILLLNIHLSIFKVLSGVTTYTSYLEIIKLPIFGIFSIVLMSILGLIILLCLKHFKFNQLLLHAIHEHANLINIISTLNLSIVLLIFYRFFETLSQNIFYILALDMYFYFSLELVIHLCHSTYLKQKINNLQLCNRTVLSMYDNTRAFKHDFHNIIQAIGGYVKTKDMDGLTKYYSQVSNDCIISNNLAKLNPKLVNNPAIYNILADKYYLANLHNIQINLDVMLDLNRLNMNIYELTRVLGILLDNAIEASKECPEKSINIAFKQDQQKQVLTIENTYTNKEICIDKIFDKDFTTKPHNTGLGLWEVRKILNRNNNLNLHTTKNKNYFSQQLEIYSA